LTKQQYYQARSQLALRYKDEKTELALSYKAEKTALYETYKQAKSQLLHSYNQAKSQLALSYTKAKNTLAADYKAQKKLIPPKPLPIEITGGSCDPIYREQWGKIAPWGCLLQFFSDRPGLGYFQYRRAGLKSNGKPYTWRRYSMERYNGTTYVWELQNKRYAKNDAEYSRAWSGSYEFRGAVWDRATKKYSYSSFILHFNFE